VAAVSVAVVAVAVVATVVATVAAVEAATVAATVVAVAAIATVMTAVAATGMATAIATRQVCWCRSELHSRLRSGSVFQRHRTTRSAFGQQHYVCHASFLCSRIEVVPSGAALQS